QAQNAASDAVSQGNVPIYSTRNAVETLEIPAGITAFRTNGFSSVGDGGAALYKRVTSEPAHAGKVMSADGAWWELAETEPNVKMFGAVGDGVANDQAEIVAAVSYAFAQGVSLLWPDGVFVSTGNIPNFHNVRHFGLGRIKRGADIFHIQASRSTTNRIYVSGAGAYGNDGLSAAEPIDNLNNAFLWATLNREKLAGAWEFIKAGSTKVTIRHDQFVAPSVVLIPGDFAHMDEAFAFLRNRPVAFNNIIDVRFQSGYQITKGIGFLHDDFSRVQIVSDDAI